MPRDQIPVYLINWFNDWVYQNFANYIRRQFKNFHYYDPFAFNIPEIPRENNENNHVNLPNLRENPRYYGNPDENRIRKKLNFVSGYLAIENLSNELDALHISEPENPEIKIEPVVAERHTQIVILNKKIDIQKKRLVLAKSEVKKHSHVLVYNDQNDTYYFFRTNNNNPNVEIRNPGNPDNPDSDHEDIEIEDEDDEHYDDKKGNFTEKEKPNEEDVKPNITYWSNEQINENFTRIRDLNYHKNKSLAKNIRNYIRMHGQGTWFFETYINMTEFNRTNFDVPQNIENEFLENVNKHAKKSMNYIWKNLVSWAGIIVSNFLENFNTIDFTVRSAGFILYLNGIRLPGIDLGIRMLNTARYLMPFATLLNYINLGLDRNTIIRREMSRFARQQVIQYGFNIINNQIIQYGFNTVNNQIINLYDFNQNRMVYNQNTPNFQYPVMDFGNNLIGPYNNLDIPSLGQIYENVDRRLRDQISLFIRPLIGGDRLLIPHNERLANHFVEFRRTNAFNTLLQILRSTYRIHPEYFTNIPNFNNFLEYFNLR